MKSQSMGRKWFEPRVYNPNKLIEDGLNQIVNKHVKNIVKKIPSLK